MMSTIRKLLAAFLLGVVSHSFTADMARAQGREMVKRKPKPQPTKTTKDKKIDVPKREVYPEINHKKIDISKAGVDPARPTEKPSATHKSTLTPKGKLEDK